MTEIHEQAIEASIKFEAKKNTLSQTQTGDWKINLVIQALDMPDELTSAAMGQRFMCVMVALDEGEEPIKIASTKTASKVSTKSNNVAQACILCAREKYQSYLNTEYGNIWHSIGDKARDREDLAKFTMYKILGIGSRSEVATGDAAIRFKEHVYNYNQWKNN